MTLATTRSYQQLGQVRLLLRDLIHRALPRRLVRPPAQKFRPVAKAVAGEMIVSNFDHELRLERLPPRGAAGRPSARTAGRAAGEPGRRDELLELEGERLLLDAVDGRGEAHVVQKPILAIGPELELANHRIALVVAETPDHAVRAAIVLLLLHSGALARAIVDIAALGDDAVEHGADVLEPRLCLAQSGGGRRQSN